MHLQQAHSLSSGRLWGQGAEWGGTARAGAACGAGRGHMGPEYPNKRDYIFSFGLENVLQSLDELQHVCALQFSDR